MAELGRDEVARVGEGRRHLVPMARRRRRVDAPRENQDRHRGAHRFVEIRGHLAARPVLAGAHELVHKLLGQLKPDDQLVIKLLDLEQKTIAEISAQTGWNQTLVKVRAFRARRKLQKLFQELQSKERS